jgi:hypothetical protein
MCLAADGGVLVVGDSFGGLFGLDLRRGDWAFAYPRAHGLLPVACCTELCPGMVQVGGSSREGGLTCGGGKSCGANGTVLETRLGGVPSTERVRRRFGPISSVCQVSDGLVVGSHGDVLCVGCAAEGRLMPRAQLRVGHRAAGRARAAGRVLAGRVAGGRQGAGGRGQGVQQACLPVGGMGGRGDAGRRGAPEPGVGRGARRHRLGHCERGRDHPPVVGVRGRQCTQRRRATEFPQVAAQTRGGGGRCRRCEHGARAGGVCACRPGVRRVGGRGRHAAGLGRGVGAAAAGAAVGPGLPDPPARAGRGSTRAGGGGDALRDRGGGRRRSAFRGWRAADGLRLRGRRRCIGGLRSGSLVSRSRLARSGRFEFSLDAASAPESEEEPEEHATAAGTAAATSTTCANSLASATKRSKRRTLPPGAKRVATIRTSARVEQVAATPGDRPVLCLCALPGTRLGARPGPCLPG